MRRTISVSILLALILAPAEIAAARNQNALRSGTIEGGTSPEQGGERSGCEYALDCLAWLQSDCEPALAGHDPALTASIVDVGDLADGRTRRSFHTAAPGILLFHAGLWPGAVVQLWRQNCTEIHHAKRYVSGSAASCGVVRCKAFRIPTGARWMTVSGYVTTWRLSWTLT